MFYLNRVWETLSQREGVRRGKAKIEFQKKNTLITVIHRMRKVAGLAWGGVGVQVNRKLTASYFFQKG